MKYRVCIQTRAIRDIDEACGGIAAQAPDAAERWFSAIEAEIFSLARFPERCPRAREADLFTYDLRQLVYGRKHGRLSDHLHYSYANCACVARASRSFAFNG
jgi:plasmid stabilization system protein ParE